MARHVNRLAGMRVVVFASWLWVVACRPPGYGKGDDHTEIDAPPASRDAAAIDAAIDAAPAACSRQFRLDGHGAASSVWLTGDFVSWAGTPAAGAVVLALGGDGGWTGAREFPAGTYLYKFVVDGTQWIADPMNADGVDDGHGGKNSRYVCTP